MVVMSAELRFRIPQAHSLKHKRQACRSLLDRAKRKFNVAIAEVDTQDVHQILTIGVAVVSGLGHHAREVLDAVIHYLEQHTEAELLHVEYFD